MSTRFAYPHRRRAATAVFVLVTLPVLIGFAALTIDVGYMYNVRAELQSAADSAALAAVGALADDPNYGDEDFLPYEASVRAIAQQFAEANHEVNGILANADFALGNWDWDMTVFTAAGAPINAVRVVTRRSDANSNPVHLFFAGIFGMNKSNISAAAVAYAPPPPAPVEVGFWGLIDDEMFDTDEPAIEALAAALGVLPGDLLSDGDGDGFIDLPPGAILELPTGQVGDEGLFEITESFPFTTSSNPSVLDFLLYDPSGNQRGIVPDDLSPLLGVEPVSDPAVYPSFVDPNQVLISPVWDSDISDIEPGVNAQGLRRGLVVFKIIGVGVDPPGSYLPNLIIEIVSPVSIDLDGTGLLVWTGANLQIVQ